MHHQIKGRRSQVAKAEVCKTFIHRFDSDRRLHDLSKGFRVFLETLFLLLEEPPPQAQNKNTRTQNKMSTGVIKKPGRRFQVP